MWVEGQRHRLSAPVAAALRDARRARGLTLRQAAELCGASYGYLCLLEHSERCPSVDMARAIVRGLELDAEVAARLLDEALPYAGRSWAPKTREKELV